MDEVISSVLSNETLTTNEERVEAIKKGLATVVIPKDKFNAQSTKLQNTEGELASLKIEYEDYKKSKMTEDEKKEAREKEFAEKEKANNIRESELAVKSLLLDNGIKITDDDKELKETLENIIGEDVNKSLKLASSFISLLNKTKTTAEQETTTKLLNNTPKPVGGANSSSAVSTIDTLTKDLDEAIKSKDVVKQTQLMTRIFQEKQKLKM